jgi:hypothetical protein
MAGVKMASSPPPSSLTELQRELLAAFFDREKRFFLTGGGALAGFYFGHRTTDDLDFFSPPGPSLDDAQHALEDAAAFCGATTATVRSFQEFRRLVASRGDEQCVIDLVIDRAPAVDGEKASFGALRQPERLTEFRDELVESLRALALRAASRS